MTYRYIDDISTINDKNTFAHVYKDIYLTSLTLEKVNSTHTAAVILDIKVEIRAGIYDTKLFDKRSNFPFKCNVFPAFDSDISIQCISNVITNEIVRIFSICSNIENFQNDFIQLKTLCLVTKKYSQKLWRQAFNSFCKRYKSKYLRKYNQPINI